MRALAVAAAVAALAAPSSALAMPATAFLARADALLGKGPFALFLSDYRLLKKIGQDTGAELRAERDAQLRAHRPTAYCSPSGAVSMGDREMVAGLHRIAPAALRAMDVKAAFRTVLAAKYPCPR